MAAYPHNLIIYGDALEELRKLPDGFVQVCVTSPPYWGLRDYGVEGQLGLEPTPEEYVKRMTEIFREVRRVLRADGTLWLNMGDSYASRDRQTRDPGRSKLHPPFEKWKGGRPGTPQGLKPKDLCGMPWRLAFALQADGWYLRSDIIWSKPNPMPESVTDRPTRAHEYLFLLSKAARYYYDADAIREESIQGYYVLPNAKVKDGCKTKLSGMFRNVGDAGRGVQRGNDWSGGCKDPTWRRNKRSVWEIAKQPYPGTHFATFPEALVEPCILAGSKPGDLVLDPFIGSGTTAAVAWRLGRDYLGIELNRDYEPLITQRLAEAKEPRASAIAGKPILFEGEGTLWSD